MISSILISLHDQILESCLGWDYGGPERQGNYLSVAHNNAINGGFDGHPIQDPEDRSNISTRGTVRQTSEMNCGMSIIRFSTRVRV